MDDNTKHSLGSRAFYLFFSHRIKWPIILTLITLLVWYAERWISGVTLIWWGYGLEILVLIDVAIILFALLQTWLEYRYYTYMFTEEAFIMTYGVMVRNEVAALYHQIQNVSIQRGMLDRMIGVSQIIIFLTGAERESSHTKIVLPAVGRKKAKMVQKELLVRARKNVG